MHVSVATALKLCRLCPHQATVQNRHLARVAGSRVDDELTPVFQYVGERAKRKDRVFVWGFSFTGALGIPSFVVPDTRRKTPKKMQLTPYRLDMEEKISSAACGYGFTLLSSRTNDLNKVWGMGLNTDSQIGFHRSRRDRTKGYEYILEPSPVPLPLDKPQETRVLHVSCGRAHSLVLTDNEGVFTMGNNSYGQCGRKIVEGEVYSESQLISRLQSFGSKITQIVCGQDHSLFRTEKGEIYACGWGADGQTGLGHYNPTATPTKLKGDIAGVNIVQIDSYGDCCLAVSEDGEIFGWGNSEYLQLAVITESTQLNVPRHLPFKEVGKVKQVVCGGTGSALLKDRGELFVWGKNLRGCLGIGTSHDQYFPWRVTVPGEVVDVACGVDHMVALVKSFI